MDRNNNWWPKVSIWNMLYVRANLKSWLCSDKQVQITTVIPLWYVGQIKIQVWANIQPCPQHRETRSTKQGSKHCTVKVKQYSMVKINVFYIIFLWCAFGKTTYISQTKDFWTYNKWWKDPYGIHVEIKKNFF